MSFTIRFDLCSEHERPKLINKSPRLLMLYYYPFNNPSLGSVLRWIAEYTVRLAIQRSSTIFANALFSVLWWMNWDAHSFSSRRPLPLFIVFLVITSRNQIPPSCHHQSLLSFIPGNNITVTCNLSKLMTEIGVLGYFTLVNPQAISRGATNSK